ncbi:MAG: tail fiber domain-containing protein [Phycisphaerales bacterium]
MAALGCVAGAARAQTDLGTAYAFTYQGSVMDSGGPANGVYDLRFALFNEPSGGDGVGPVLCFDEVVVSDGHVTRALDFGDIYAGQVLWLEMSVRAGGAPGDCAGGAYTTMTPRQQLTVAPFAGQAISALTAGSAGSLGGLTPSFFQNAANLSSGTLADGRLSSNVVLGSSNQTITGAKSFSSDITLLNDDATITFSAADGVNSPMIQMFASGASNGTRMVLAHSAGLSTTGLRYNDGTDAFEFANGGVSKLGVSLATGRLRFDDAAGGLSFASTAASGSPLITMFPAETGAGVRYLFAESAVDGSTNFGYDAATDSFTFLFNGGDEVIQFDVPNGRVGLGRPPQDRLDIGGVPGLDGIRFPDGTRQTSASPWRASPLAVVYTGGNVGLGTEAPTMPLHMVRDFDYNTIRVQGQQVITGANTAVNGGAAVTSPIGSGAGWSGVSSAGTVDGVSASVSLTQPGGTAAARQLKFTNLGLNVPANATITGLRVHVQASASGACPSCQGTYSGVYYFDVVRVTDGTTTSPDRYSQGYGVGGDYGYSTVDMWAMGLTPAMVNSPAFGVVFDVSMYAQSTYDSYPNGQTPYTCTSCEASATVSVDGVTVTVYYGAPTVGSGDYVVGMGPGTNSLVISPVANFASPAISVSPNGQTTMSNNGFAGHVLVVQGTAAKPGGGSWSTTSDVRLKHGIRPLSGTLDTLLSLRGYSYEYNEDEVKAGRVLPGRQVGLLAQEVQRVFPDWVTAREDGYLTVTERSTTALMVEALRDLRREKDEGLARLQEELSALREENRALRDRVEALERR